MLALLAPLAPTQIERLDLEAMVSKTDNAVFGQIVERRVFSFDHPTAGPNLTFTALTVKGRSLADGRATTVEVIHAGGVDENGKGVWNSEAPRPEVTARGKNVVVFYKWIDNMGGDLAGNALYASHGGVYRTVEGPKGTVVLGRGEGYAVKNNQRLTSLESAVRTLRQKAQEK